MREGNQVENNEFAIKRKRYQTRERETSLNSKFTQLSAYFQFMIKFAIVQSSAHVFNTASIVSGG
jgi:hypothetical protein